MLSIVDATEELDLDNLSDSIRALFLEKIKEKINCDKYNSKNKTIDEINDDLEKKHIRSAWEKGTAFETEHWKDYLLNKVEDFRLDPHLPLSKEITEFLRPARLCLAFSLQTGWQIRKSSKIYNDEVKGKNSYIK